jgi:uncharacterized protein (DUF2267 family)
MSAQGLEVLEKSLQATHEWINDLAERLDTPDRRAALRLLRAVLHALRDRVSHEEAAHLAAQLPIVLRGMFYENWRPSRTPVEDRGRDAFLAEISRLYDAGPEFPLESDVEEVFRLLNLRVSAGEVADIRGALPADLRALWPE